METGKVIKSVGVVGFFTMLSRILGLARDVVMAGWFGTSTAMSAFVIAFTIPNLFRRLFGEGALSSSFIPVFVESRKKEGDAPAWDFAARVLTMAGSFLSVLSLAGVAVSILFMTNPQWVARLASLGSREGLLETLTLMFPLLAIMFPYVLFICLAALGMGILNSFHKFAVPAATPCILNLALLMGVYLVVPHFGATKEEQIFGVAWVIIAAGLVQMLFQLPAMWKIGYRPRLAPPAGDARVRKVLQLMGPAALGLAVTQFNVVIDRVLAAWVGPHAPAALFFSERLIYLPLGLFATAVGTVLLPVLAGHAAGREADRALRTVNHSLRLLMMVMAPAAAGLLVLAHPIVQMIYEWKEFSHEATWYTATALQFYAPGLVVFSLAKVFVPAFYAHQDTRTPVKVGVMAVLLNLSLNLLFINTWPEQYKHAGLAFATVLSEGAFALTLAVLLHRRFGSPGWLEVLKSAVRILFVSILMGLVVAWSYTFLSSAVPGWFDITGKAAQITIVMASIGLGMGFYLLASYLAGSPEIRTVRTGLENRLKRKKS